MASLIPTREAGGAAGPRWAAEPRWLAELRLAALDRFSHLAWPSPQEEEWRRTDLSRVDFRRYGEVQACVPVLSGGSEPDGALPPGVLFLALEQAAREHPERLRPVLEEEAARLENRLQAWHFSLLAGGAFLYVPPFVEIARPLQVDVPVSGEGALDGGAVSAPHVVVILDTGARASVVVRLRQEGAGQVLVNAAVTLRLAEGAGLRLVQVQDLGGDALFFHHGTARQGRDSRLLSIDAALGARLLKTRLDCSLEGPGAEALLNGLYHSRGAQHMDIRTVQRHRAPRATSRAFYKGAVQDQARTVFQGLIEVFPGAAGTDAYLSNKNLILSDGARADSIPSLRIDNNDVRCSHGSTTGRINEEELFYLGSRGLDRNEARRMLVEGYFEELLEQIAACSPEAEAQVRARLGARLADPLGERLGELEAAAPAAVPAGAGG